MDRLKAISATNPEARKIIKEVSWDQDCSKARFLTRFMINNMWRKTFTSTQHVTSEATEDVILYKLEGEMRWFNGQNV